MVAVDILTGYLGAGKTTLLRHALGHGLDGRRVAIVVNELGDIGVDGTLLAGPAGIDAMVELTNGCICCTIDERRFDRAIVELVDRTDAALVVLETTGVADPIRLGERLRRLGFGIDAVTTVVDAAAIDEQRRREPVVERQIAAADFLVVGKVDLVSTARVAAVQRSLRRANPRATQLTAERGRVDPSLLFASGVKAWRERHSTEDGSDARGIEAFTFRTPDPVDLEGLEHVLGALPPAIVRAKGIFRVTGAEAQCVFNYTNGRYETSWLRLPAIAESQAVFIGRNIHVHEAAVRAALDACIRPERPVAEGGVRSWFHRGERERQCAS